MISEIHGGEDFVPFRLALQPNTPPMLGGRVFVAARQKVSEVIFPKNAYPLRGWGDYGRWRCEDAHFEDGTFGWHFRFIWEVWQ